MLTHQLSFEFFSSLLEGLWVWEAEEHTRQDFATKFTRGFLQNHKNWFYSMKPCWYCCDFSEQRAWDRGSSEGGRSLVLVSEKKTVRYILPLRTGYLWPWEGWLCSSENAVDEVEVMEGSEAVHGVLTKKSTLGKTMSCVVTDCWINNCHDILGSKLKLYLSIITQGIFLFLV